MIHLTDETATERLAGWLAPRLPEGAVLLLQGPMGAGKTTFVRHLARALGFAGRVTSPTYTLMHTYPTPSGPLLHVDVYRLPEAEALPGGRPERRVDGRRAGAHPASPSSRRRRSASSR